MNQWDGEWGVGCSVLVEGGLVALVVVGGRLVGFVVVVGGEDVARLRLATVARRRASVEALGDMLLAAARRCASASDMLADRGFEVLDCRFEVRGGGGFRFREKRRGRWGIGV